VRYQAFSSDFGVVILSETKNLSVPLFHFSILPTAGRRGLLFVVFVFYGALAHGFGNFSCLCSVFFPACLPAILLGGCHSVAKCLQFV
jgi:hypothetical protein